MVKVPPQEFWIKFKSTYGALSTAEAIAIYNVCLQSPQGNWMELGSHKGKSSLVISSAMSNDSRFIMVDPVFENEQWANEVIETVSDNRAIMISGYSLDVLPMYNELAFCFVDSGIHDEMIMDEVRILEKTIMRGGVICFHDYLNQFTPVEMAYKYLVSTYRFEPIEIDWDEIFEYVAAHNLEEGNASWHIYEELPHPPNFVGALRRK